jgi:hypothetical protein
MEKLWITYQKASDYEETGNMEEINRDLVELPDQEVSELQKLEARVSLIEAAIKSAPQ